MKTIELTRGQVALVDDATFETLSQWKWCALKAGRTYYAIRRYRDHNGKQKTAYMHHCIVGYPLKGFETDHINGNSLDNRSGNLRNVTHRENQSNQLCHRTMSKSSRYVGVSYQAQTKKWMAYISLDGIRKYLGLFANEDHAGAAYQAQLAKATI